MITEALLNKMALIKAIDIEILGMQIANKQCISEGRPIIYNDADFFNSARELRKIASSQNIGGGEHSEDC